MSLPWPITRVEARGGTVVRVWHVDGTVADHVFDYLLARGGVFATLTTEMIRTARILDDTVAWALPDGGVIDLAADALYEHGYSRCPGSCTGWTPAHTRLVRPPEG